MGHVKYTIFVSAVENIFINPHNSVDFLKLCFWQVYSGLGVLWLINSSDSWRSVTDHCINPGVIQGIADGDENPPSHVSPSVFPGGHDLGTSARPLGDCLSYLGLPQKNTID